MSRSPLPPFTLETALQTVRSAVDTRPRFRSDGSGRRAFDREHVMHARVPGIDDLPIAAAQRHDRWPAHRRPDAPAGRTALGL